MITNDTTTADHDAYDVWCDLLKHLPRHFTANFFDAFVAGRRSMVSNAKEQHSDACDFHSKAVEARKLAEDIEAFASRILVAACDSVTGE